ncbi:hypothetical protein RFI_35175, partial [Reticulomyxa filosa]
KSLLPQFKDERVVIFSDCKFAVSAIRNKCNSETYNFLIAERLMKELGDNGVPEIYWIKGHSGNERSGVVAKRARFQAEFEQLNYLGKQQNKITNEILI